MIGKTLDNPEEGREIPRYNDHTSPFEPPTHSEDGCSPTSAGCNS